MNNLRYALRQFRRRPGFAATVIAMLAVGIGATTAIHTLFHQVLVRALPVPAAHELVNLGIVGERDGGTSCNDAGGCDEVFSYPMFRDLQARQTVFTDVAAHRQFDADFVADGRSFAGSGMLVSASYFEVLRLQPALGRLLVADDERAIGESAVAVLSYEQWRSRFGSDVGVIGKRITVNGQTLTIVGVAPEGFTGTTVGNRAHVFVPITLRWLMEPSRAQDAEDRRSHWAYLFARLAPGVSPAEAAAGSDALYSGLVAELETAQTAATRIAVTPGARGQSAIAADVQAPLALLLGVTALVLLIVCVNVANLLLARGAGRAGEMAIRTSLGAGRRQLVTQLLTEAALLAAAGGVAGLPIAYGVLTAITALLPQSLAGGFGVQLGAGAALTAAGAAFAALFVFGIVPALQGARAGTGAVMKSQAAQAVGGRGVARFRGALATAQIAFSTILLVLAGLFAQSLANVNAVDLGLNTDELVTFTLAPRRSGYSAEQQMAIFDRVEEALAAQPGVSDAASSRILLLDGRRWGAGPLTVEGIEREPVTDVLVNAVSPSFFRTLSIALQGGRNLAATDGAGAPPVAVVNERFVRRFGLGADAIGKRVRAGGNRTFEIVGVVADAKYSTVKDDVPPQLFIPRHQFPNLDAASFYVRGGIAPAALLDLVPRVVADVDPQIAVSRLATMRAHVDDNTYLDRVVALLAAGFALLATLLAAIGLYGVLAYNVRQRTRELGLRLALGASPKRLRSMVLTQVLRMALVALPAGLAAAVALGSAAEALLFGLTGYDPAVLLGAAVVLSAVVLAAASLPARAAARVAPMEALRCE